MILRAILFPAFDVGRFLIIIALVIVSIIIALITGDREFALYAGVGGYLGMGASILLNDKLPKKIEINKYQKAELREFLGCQDGLTEIESDTWAVYRYKSWLWKSDRVCIIEGIDKRLYLKSTGRNIKAIVGNVWPKGLQ